MSRATPETMQIPRTGLELLQATLDNRFGGDEDLLAARLARIEREYERPGMPMFEKVGNNNLVFFSNDRAKKVCEDNPETIQGVIVDDYDCWIHPEAVVIGSFLRGTVGSPARIDRGSKVFYSNIVMSHIVKTQVYRSRVSNGSRVENSRIKESMTSGSLFNMRLTRSFALVGQIANMSATGKILGYDSRKDRRDTNGFVAGVLERYGLRQSPAS